MQEFMYDIDGAWIAVLLFASLVLVIDAGYRLGARNAGAVDEAFKTHVNSLSAAVLGILALVLGFTFSLALQRYDHRSEAVVEEANALGTTWLRAQLLPESARTRTQAALQGYLEARLEEGRVALDAPAGRAALLAKAAALQATLWSLAREAANEAPTPVTALFIAALNETFDNLGRREAALARHIPEIVLLLLYATFLMAGAIVGYAAGIAGHRASFVTYLMVALIVVLVYVILDLDRPRRGFVQVSQQSMIELQAVMAAGLHAPAPPEAGR